jgi:hypothetical protein
VAAAREALVRFAKSVEQVVVVEANHQGQLALLIAANTPICRSG